MSKLLLKELRLGVNPFFYALPFLTGALMLIPAWLYFLVNLYFCFITIPNMFAGYKSNNDLLFTTVLPVSKKDIVTSRILFVVFLELLHIGLAIIFGLISVRLYPEVNYIFFGPTWGFWGLNFIMLAIFNIIFFPIYFKTAYKYGVATVLAITAAIAFAGGAEWLGLQNSFVKDLFKGAGADNGGVQLTILLIGIVIFVGFTWIAYRISNKRFAKVEL